MKGGKYIRRCMIGLLAIVMLLTGNITSILAADTDSVAGMDSATEIDTKTDTDSTTENTEPIDESINGWVKKNGVWYYYKKGITQTGWQYIGKKWYYMDADGAMQTGWLELGEKVYYLNSSGAMVTGWKWVDGKWYYFKSSGQMVIGWIQTGGKWYFLNESGEMVTGVYKVSGKTYCFDGNGVMLKNGWKNVGGKWYYLSASGAAHTGWQMVGSKWYYMDNSGVMQTGWRKISGTWYYLQTSGAMIETGWQKLGGRWYYFERSGAMKSGWQIVSEKWYYLGEADDGAMKTGWLTVGGETYYLNSSGAMLGGGWHKIDGSWYLMYSSGKILTGWQNVNGKWYYMDKTSGKMLTGWQKIDGKWYYMYSDGSMAKNTYVGQYWVNNSGEWVELSESEGNIAAIRKMFYAVETGGLIYGNCRYDDVTGVYGNTANETAIMIGAGQWYATEAQELLNLIRQTDSVMFQKMDTAGIGADLDSENWNYYAIDADGAKGQCIKAIINTPIGRQCQDQMMDKQIRNYLETAKSAGITDLGGQVMYAETRHLGGKSAADRILGHCEKPYNAYNYYVAVTTTWPEDANYNAPVTSYKTRHGKIYNWIQEHLVY